MKIIQAQLSVQTADGSDVKIFSLYYTSQNIRMFKLGRTTRIPYVARIRELRNAYKILVGIPEGKRHLEKVYVDGMIILKWSLTK
jgi:hypothetical protein